MKIPLSARGQSAFTLIEVVISTALMSVVLASAYVCLNAGTSSQKVIDSRSDLFQTARVALTRISADLRSACPLSPNYDFLGMPRMIGETSADNLDFGTHNYIPQREQESDFCEVSYFVQTSATGKLSLWRRRDPTPDDNPLSGGTQEEIATGVLGLQYEYYDGFDWYPQWGDPTGKRQASNNPEPNVSGMPEAVRITLVLDAEISSRSQESQSSTNHQRLVFQTIARLNLAPLATTTSSSSGSGQSSGQSQPNRAGPGGPQ